ncbi:putative reverse transcriptase domain-containing protein [Tanacetum coccineum]
MGGRSTLYCQGEELVLLESDGTLNDVNPFKDVVSPFVIDEPVAKEMQSPLVDKTNVVKTSFQFPYVIYTEGNGVDVVVPVESIRAISERNTWGKFDLVKSMLNSSTRLFSFQFSSIDDLNLMLENDPWFIRNHPLILRKWNPDVDLLKEDVRNVPVCVKLHGVPVMASSYARAMIELRADVELKDTIVVAMPKITGEGSNIPRILDWVPVPKKPTANSSGIKKKGVEPTNEVEYPNDHDSEDEVASVDNDMAHSMASERVGFGTQSLLEQWRDSYGNGDYDEDPYDDDMYEAQDLPKEIQTICDNLDIRVRGRKKK